jgi:hypothetical protein
LQERYGDDSSTHAKLDPDLWLEVRSSSGLDKNQVYGISNTTTEDIRTDRSVLIVGSLQSG